MKVLLIHNYYGLSSPSGENLAFELESNLLEKNGFIVKKYVRMSDEIRHTFILGKIKGGLSTPWNPFSAQAVKEIVHQWRPDVVHAHNLFPLISASIFRSIGSMAAKVLTLHNYRIVCPAAIPLREGSTCIQCIDKRSAFPALLHGCYRNSRLATLPLAINTTLHRHIGTWRNSIDAFIALTSFQRDLLIQAGLPAQRIHTKPNFFPGNPRPVPWEKRGDYVVFAGRLSHEKGLVSLVNAWKLGKDLGLSLPPLRIIGSGPLECELRSLASGSPISFMGQLSPESTQEQISNAKLLVIPSECFEGFPMVLREAFAFGTPVALSNLGPLPSLIDPNISGMVFEPGIPLSLLNCIERIWYHDGVLERLGRGSRDSFLRNYTEDSNFSQLMNIYENAIDVNRKNV